MAGLDVAWQRSIQARVPAYPSLSASGAAHGCTRSSPYSPMHHTPTCSSPCCDVSSERARWRRCAAYLARQMSAQGGGGVHGRE